MGTAAAGAALVASAFFSILAVHAACTNPATIPAGFAAPCPVFSLSSTSITQAQTLTLSALPQPGTDYIYTTAYVSQGTAWNPYTLSGNNAYPSYSSALASLTLSSTQLQSLSLGTHYAVVWDWLWDATANCYKGPGLNQCNTGTWRVQSFSLTSSATPTPTPTASPYTYSQSSYYAYSQSSYYAYSQSAYTGGSTPYTGTPYAIPGQIETENYDKGGEGVAYHDTDTVNQGGQYRTTEGVDIEATTDTGGGYDVGYTAAGEWLNYTVNVQTTGSYTLNVRVASSGQGGTFHVMLDSTNVSGTLTVPNTGGWQTWTTLTKSVSPTSGIHILKLVEDTVGSGCGCIGNFNWLQFTSGTYTYSQSSYYAYSQSSYYAYSQSAYYAYSQAAYTGGNAIPVAFFGQHFSSPNSNWPSSPVQIGAMGKCAGATWPWIESANGVYNWGALDNCVNVATSHGVSYFESDDCTSGSSPAGCTNGIPSWTTCANLATDYKNFIQAKVNRYGTRMIYELWNEPETVGCSITQFVAAINAAHDVIRATAPGALILAPSFGSSMMHNFYANGGTQDVDAWTAHVYTNPNPLPGYPENLISMLAPSKTEMLNWPTANSKPLWMTEGNSYTNYNGSGLPDDATKAAYIARYHLLMWSQGARRVYWYRYDDSAYGPIFGFPVAVTGYVQTENWMVGSTMTSNCAASGTVWTCGLKNSSGVQTQVVWNTAGASTYTVPTGYGHYKDLAGNTNAISGSTVTIGIQPILLVP